MRMDLGSDMRFTAQPEQTTALVFIPDVDWSTFTEPNIIHRF